MRNHAKTVRRPRIQAALVEVEQWAGRMVKHQNLRLQNRADIPAGASTKCSVDCWALVVLIARRAQIAQWLVLWDAVGTMSRIWGSVSRKAWAHLGQTERTLRLQDTQRTGCGPSMAKPKRHCTLGIVGHVRHERVVVLSVCNWVRQGLARAAAEDAAALTMHSMHSMHS